MNVLCSNSIPHQMMMMSALTISHHHRTDWRKYCTGVGDYDTGQHASSLSQQNRLWHHLSILYSAETLYLVPITLSATSAP
mmetsp:Transcript_3929/g.8309  ORF Transcript_3929/g.8309 Transcript_3929/m.8309 type:complete len:81 (-) Transcript_3929:2311-2553(-)